LVGDEFDMVSYVHESYDGWWTNKDQRQFLVEGPVPPPRVKDAVELAADAELDRWARDLGDKNWRSICRSVGAQMRRKD
jgi:hypothetical protein